MNASDKAYAGAAAVFNAPHKEDYPSEKSMKVGVQVLRILDECTNDDFATVLMACIMVLGERLAASPA